MPVPVSPRKASSQEDVPQQASTPGRWMPQPHPESAHAPHTTNTQQQQQQQHHAIIPQYLPQVLPPQVANRVQPSTVSQNQSHRENEDISDPEVAAGYQDCLKETLRFLLYEENLSADHPVVLGLAQHLTRQHAHVELTKVTQQITQDLPQRQHNLASTSMTPPSSPTTMNRGFEVTLVEDNSVSDSEDMDLDDDDDGYIDEEDMTEEELEETEQLLTDPEFRKQLLRMMYQGCDLIATPSQSSHIIAQQ